MIVSCPSCATRYDIADQHVSAEGMSIRCRACGHRWIESRAVQVIDVSPAPAPMRLTETEREVERLIEASAEARAVALARKRRHQSDRRAWACFAMGLVLPVALLALFPETVVRAAPAAARLYERAGIKVNIYGLEISNVQQEHVLANGVRLLSIKGEIVNISQSDRKIPALRFALRGKDAVETYAWTVESTVRPLRPGESTTFTTRVASPPETSANVEIRFARLDEIGSNAAP